jgi:hypothetical protein
MDVRRVPLRAVLKRRFLQTFFLGLVLGILLWQLVTHGFSVRTATPLIYQVSSETYGTSAS